jgi:hypothetical protein
MGVDLIWMDERGGLIEVYDDSDFLFAEAIEKQDLAKTTCLQFVDLYGNTIFNQLQIPTLIKELEWFLSLFQDKPTQEIITKYLQLAKRCAGKTHTYLEFKGD